MNGDSWVADSWTIADYLENRFVDRPSLFGGIQGRALSRLHSILGDNLVGGLARSVPGYDI